MNNLLKWLAIVVVVLIVFAVIGKKAGWFGGQDKKQVVAEQVAKRDITEVVSASGKIQPEVEVKISPDVSGEIVELNVKEGDRVKKVSSWCEFSRIFINPTWTVPLPR